MCSKVLRRGKAEYGHQMDTKIHTLGALCGNTDELVRYSLTLRKRAVLRLRLRRSHENTLPSHSPRTRPRNLLLCRFQNPPVAKYLGRLAPASQGAQVITYTDSIQPHLFSPQKVTATEGSASSSVRCLKNTCGKLSKQTDQLGDQWLGKHRDVRKLREDVGAAPRPAAAAGRFHPAGADHPGS